MAYRQAASQESFAERHLDDLILTEVDIAPAQAGRYVLSVRMRSNVDAMTRRFGLVLTTYLRAFVMRRATSEYSGRILVDSAQMQLVREHGFSKLDWSQLTLPRQCALVIQSYPAALASEQSRGFELARLVAAPFQPPAGQHQAEDAALSELAQHAQDLRSQLWVEEQPPLPTGMDDAVRRARLSGPQEHWGVPGGSLAGSALRRSALVRRFDGLAQKQTQHCPGLVLPSQPQ